MRIVTLMSGSFQKSSILIRSFILLLGLLVSSPLYAQEGEDSFPAVVKAPQSKIFEAVVRATGPVSLMAGSSTPVSLWGVDDIEASDATFKLKARTALDNAIGASKVECEIKKRKGKEIFAQCVNKNDLDLGLFMIQKGYAVVDRAHVYGTVFEDAYVQAEMRAQDKKLGIWSSSAQGGGLGSLEGGIVMIAFGFALFLCVIVAFATLSIIIMRGFQKVIDAQNDNIEMVGKERKLREKERRIVAVMLDSELKANKAKIEAYLVVYDEVLTSLNDTSREPRYKVSGDMVQKQPALDRSVFDRNTDKLDIFGERLSSELIHFYARIKSTPDFTNLEPEMDLEDAVKIVETALDGARRMNKLADHLIEAFSRSDVLNSLQN